MSQVKRKPLSRKALATAISVILTAPLAQADQTWTYTYNSQGQVASADGPRTNVSDVTTYTYDGEGNLASVTNPLGQTKTMSDYNALGLPGKEVNANGVVTLLTYNSQGKLLTRTVQTPNGDVTTRFSYDPDGLLTKMTMPSGRTLKYSYDAAHRLTSVVDGQGNRIEYTHDAMGDVTKTQVSDSSGTLVKTQSQVFDELGRLLKSINADGDTTVYQHDADSNLTSTTNPSGQTTSKSFDALNHLIQVTNPDNGVTTYTHDAAGNVTSVTDPRGLKTTYTYNYAGERTQVQSPDTGKTTYTYDPAGNVLTKTDARGDTTTYTYDALNRVTSASYADGTQTRYQYDQGTNGIGHLTKVISPSSTTSWTYNALGEVLTRTQTMGSVTLTTQRGYNAVGQLTSLTYPSGKTIDLSYNTNGQVTGLNLVNVGQLLSQVTYTATGNVASWMVGRFGMYQWHFDQDGRLASYDLLSHFTPFTTTLSYDKDSRITAVNNQFMEPDSVLPSRSYDYDFLGQLTDYKSGSTSRAYGYDADGNRTSRTSATSSTSYDYASASNRLLDDSNTTYQYDADGNIIEKQVAGGPNYHFTYNAANRMTKVVNANQVTTYAYNGLGQRIEKQGYGAGSVADQTRYFVYGPTGKLLGEYDGNGQPIQETVWLGSLPVSVLTPGNQPYFVYPDQLGAPREIAQFGLPPIVWKWDHGPFGQQQPTGSFTYNLRYPGQYYDKETGLDYNYYRDYDPSLGRYVESDPNGLKAGVNTYSYVENNPVNAIDPRGLIRWTGTFDLKGLMFPGGAEKGDFNLTSECVNGQKAIISVLFVGPALGKGPKFLVGSQDDGAIVFRDNMNSIKPWIFQGFAAIFSAGLNLGGKVTLGPSKIKLGQAFSTQINSSSGLDVGVSLSLGSSTLTNFKFTSCGCEK